GRPKTQSARRTLEDINPDITVVPHQTVLTSENALEILADYDVVVNGSDNFPTRYLVNDACVMLRKPLVDASILKWEGQATAFLPGRGCYRCLFPTPPPPGTVPSCADGGIVGALAGHIGTLQAIEAGSVGVRGQGDAGSRPGPADRRAGGLRMGHRTHSRGDPDSHRRDSATHERDPEGPARDRPLRDRATQRNGDRCPAPGRLRACVQPGRRHRGLDE